VLSVTNSDFEVQTGVAPESGIRPIAFYLPQYHPIPENDEWWGKGFTEWTNTAKARPLFPGHYQPHIPADLGYYDLRLPQTREAQARMAREHGVEAFCYYHYWFGNGRRLLQRPFNEVVESGKPDFPFCLCWANETWTGVWHGASNRVLIDQTYPGRADAEAHFEALLPAFLDERYVKVDGKPLFLVYNPIDLPDPKGFTELWRGLAVRSGLAGIFFVGVENSPWKPEANGFDGATTHNVHLARKCDGSPWSSRLKYHYRKLLGRPRLLFSYEEAIKHFVVDECRKTNVYPCAIPNWDNTPRSGLRGQVLDGSTPELFGKHLREIFQQVAHKPPEHQLVFVKSWNEWAEGNHLEPDRKFGMSYLQALRDELGHAAATVLNGQPIPTAKTAGQLIVP
jgi:lipopolysaccharide biosynthesis protein